MVVQIGGHGLARQPLDDLGAAQHRPAHRLIGEGAFLEMIEDDVVGRVVGLADLLQDDGALALQLGRVEDRVLQDVGEDIERERRVFFQHLGVIGCAFTRGIGVQVSADGLDLLGDGAGAAPLGALERHVFEEMGDAVDLGRLVPRADLDPEAERDRVDRVDAVGRDPQPVRERGELARSCRARRAPRMGAQMPRDRGRIVGQHRRPARGLSTIRRAPPAPAGGYRSPARPRRGIWPDARSRARPSAPRPAASRARGGDADRGVRVDQHAGLAIDLDRSSASVPRRRRDAPENSARAACQA